MKRRRACKGHRKKPSGPLPLLEAAAGSPKASTGYPVLSFGDRRRGPETVAGLPGQPRGVQEFPREAGDRKRCRESGTGYPAFGFRNCHRKPRIRGGLSQATAGSPRCPSRHRNQKPGAEHEAPDLGHVGLRAAAATAGAAVNAAEAGLPARTRRDGTTGTSLHAFLLRDGILIEQIHELELLDNVRKLFEGHATGRILLVAASDRTATPWQCVTAMATRPMRPGPPLQ